MKIRILAVILLAFLAITCKQVPIFFIISAETKPTKPRIEGAPTNMVVFNWKGTRIMAVASGRLHWYAQMKIEVENPEDPDYPLKKVSRWDLNEYSIPQPGGKIISLAVTPTRLYALCFDDHGSKTTLRYIEDGSEGWTNIDSAGDYPILQSIYADPDKEQLFAGASKSDHKTYAISYLDNNDTLIELRKDTSLFSGAVYRDGSFFLSTRGEIFQVNDDFTETKLLSNNIVIMGMIKLENEETENGPTIIAVTRDRGGIGALYEVKADSIERMMYTGNNNSGNTIATGNFPTGALALWEGPADSHPTTSMKKLIVGVQGRLSTISSSASYYHGYVEFAIDYIDNSFDTREDCRKNNSLQSVDDVDRYTASLGKHPINHLFQVPQDIDEERIFFASTQTTGLWSYRYRDNEGWKGLQWNAEE
jgi:hypothetical protein